jgi:hypothetical protein
MNGNHPRFDLGVREWYSKPPKALLLLPLFAMAIMKNGNYLFNFGIILRYNPTFTS